MSAHGGSPGARAGVDGHYALVAELRPGRRVAVCAADGDQLAALAGRWRAGGMTVAELLATLQAFLAHDGSTTETADALALHRHTVGYRLSRVQEVLGLSPYESDGRERLSLGIKAHQILEVERRLDGA